MRAPDSPGPEAEGSAGTPWRTRHRSLARRHCFDCHGLALALGGLVLG